MPSQREGLIHFSMTSHPPRFTPATFWALAATTLLLSTEQQITIAKQKRDKKKEVERRDGELLTVTIISATKAERKSRLIEIYNSQQVSQAAAEIEIDIERIWCWVS